MNMHVRSFICYHMHAKPICDLSYTYLIVLSSPAPRVPNLVSKEVLESGVIGKMLVSVVMYIMLLIMEILLFLVCIFIHVHINIIWMMNILVLIFLHTCES